MIETSMHSIYFALPDILGSLMCPTIIEIGAAEGSDTERILKFAKTLSRSGECLYFAFEPDIRNVRLFEARPELKGVHFFPRAVSNVDGFQSMSISHGDNQSVFPGDWSFSSTMKQPTGHLQRYPWVTFEEQLLVPTITLDTFLADYLPSISWSGIVDFIWCDVNGGEREVIEGGRRLLECSRFLFTEFAGEGELFEGQPNLWQLAQLLPEWELVQMFDNNVLLQNRNFMSGGKYREEYETINLHDNSKTINEHNPTDPC